MGVGELPIADGDLGKQDQSGLAVRFTDTKRVKPR